MQLWSGTCSKDHCQSQWETFSHWVQGTLDQAPNCLSLQKLHLGLLKSMLSTQKLLLVEILQARNLHSCLEKSGQPALKKMAKSSPSLPQVAAPQQLRWCSSVSILPSVLEFRQTVTINCPTLTWQVRNALQLGQQLTEKRQQDLSVPWLLHFVLEWDKAWGAQVNW